MAKEVKPGDTRIIWAFGKPYQFCWVTSDNQNLRLGLEDFEGTHANPARYQKSQIMLHCLDSNNRAETVVAGWRDAVYAANDPAVLAGSAAAGAKKTAGAHIVIERTRHTTGGGDNPQANRPAPPAGVFPDTGGFVDVFRVTDLDTNVAHGSGPNRNSIGIEHANVANSNWLAAREPSMDPATHRPRDRNRWIDLAPGHGGVPGEYQAYEDEQYNSMILMLRAICIEHRIPRQFLGDNWEERSQRYLRGFPQGVTQEEQRERRSRLYRFRGIIQHSNTHANKTCPGLIAYNRLFRGIIDEWWLPIEFEGQVRNYYSGPFWNPAFAPPNKNPNLTKPAWFRWQGGDPPTVEATVYRDADIEALTETRGYFNLNDADDYYQRCETPQGGFFPIGTNRVWHGGVHLEPQPANPVVYAAASGTIVAARVSSHSDTDAAIGSQSFVLIRHAVYWQTEPDPVGPPATGGPQGRTSPMRINYNVDPTYVFSLYMHLKPIPPDRLFVEHNDNPRWYNKWLRDQAKQRNLNPDAVPPQLPPEADLKGIVGMTDDGEKGRVFNPNVEVSVGDVLGTAGIYYGRRMIHFEVISHRDHEILFAGPPSVRDENRDMVSDSDVINRLLTDTGSPGIDRADLLRAAPNMRDVRVMHLSEWMWSAEMSWPVLVAPLTTLVDWPHIRRFIWVQEAMAANPDLRAQLGDSGFFWHYHPMTFMAAINRAIQAENREISETRFETNTNVELDEDGYLTDYFNPPNWAPASADNQPIRPYDVQEGVEALGPANNRSGPPGGEFDFTRQDLACRAGAAPHNPAVDPPQQTKFALALLDVLQRVQIRYGQYQGANLVPNRTLTVDCAFVCPAHVGEVNRCCRHDAAHVAQHAAGVAVDFHPDVATGNLQAKRNRISDLWRELKAACDAFNREARLHAGTSHSDLPLGFGGVEFKAQNDTVTNKLNATPQQQLDDPEVNAFRVHLALTAI